MCALSSPLLSCTSSLGSHYQQSIYSTLRVPPAASSAQHSIMGPSLRGTSLTSGIARPGTRDTNRPGTREQVVDTSIVPSRTSSLHSRITQPLPATITNSNNRPTPKTLTHAYMVCGVGREPSQWVKAPAPSYGKIQHMKGAVGQFWLPEILGSSPRLEQDNEVARSLHSAMRVS